MMGGFLFLREGLDGVADGMEDDGLNGRTSSRFPWDLTTLWDPCHSHPPPTPSTASHTTARCYMNSYTQSHSTPRGDYNSDVISTNWQWHLTRWRPLMYKLMFVAAGLERGSVLLTGMMPALGGGRRRCGRKTQRKTTIRRRRSPQMN